MKKSILSEPERKSYLVEREKWRVEQWHQLRTSFYVQKDGIAKLHNFLIYYREYNICIYSSRMGVETKACGRVGRGNEWGLKLGLNFPPFMNNTPHNNIIPIQNPLHHAQNSNGIKVHYNTLQISKISLIGPNRVCVGVLKKNRLSLHSTKLKLNCLHIQK